MVVHREEGDGTGGTVDRRVDRGLRRLHDLAPGLAGMADPAEVARRLAIGARSVLDVDAVALRRRGAPEDAWACVAEDQGGGERSTGRDGGVTDADLDSAARSGLPRLLPDDAGRPDGSADDPSRLLVTAAGPGSETWIVELTRLGTRRFDPDDVTLAVAFSGIVAREVTAAMLRCELDRRCRELEGLAARQRRLLDVNRLLLSTLDPRGMLELIAGTLRSVVDYDNLTIYRVDREAGLLRAVLSRDRFAEAILRDETPLDRTAGISGWVLEHGEPQCVNDAHLDPRACQIPGTVEEPESLIVVPLEVDGAVEGTLNVGRIGGPEAHFSEAEFELAKLFAAQASAALRNAEEHRAVTTRAATDALTGLRNRGAFEADVDAGMGPPAASWSLVMIDIDRFKSFNDRHGHRAGDALLAAIACAIATTVRTGDCAYRYGGDEFAVLLPATTARRAARVAERIRDAIGRIAAAQDAGISASVGVATFPDDGTAKETLVRAADAARYAAKRAGGGRVVRSDGSHGRR